MYGGLFGELPSTKKGSSKENEDSTKSVLDSQTPSSSTQSTILSGSPEPNASTAKFVPTQLFQPKRKRKAAAAKKTKNAPRPWTLPPLEQHVQGQPILTSTRGAVVTNEVENEKTSADKMPSRTVKEPVDPPELQKLHAQVRDPYDPQIPNDLLAYFEQKRALVARQRLEEEARQTLENQQRLREQLEAEKERLVQENNFVALAQNRSSLASGRGRGRGRGVNNLPAWLVAQQEKQQSSNNDRLEKS